MRVLAVRGENLASLAAFFEIDFRREPLAGAGLFAITGETGAGKSTILDAICLALYGAYPRVAIDRRESAPDPSGKEISGQDPRALLRRGAGKGFAEVDFLGSDGQAYRARWEALRARGKANGALQNELRSLIRIADNQPIASGKRDVLIKVQALTDFTFDQFRRTVLLAQGEFDAFLLAGENERAELLEKVTGTEIYAALSVRAHEEAERRKKSVEILETRLASIGLLDAPARVALAQERESLAQEVTAIGAATDALKARLEHHARIGAAREKWAEAAKVHEAALAASAGVAPERGLLAEFDKAEFLRPKAEALARAKESRARAETALTGASLLHARARDAALSATAERETAQAADLEAESQFKAFGPIWTRCGELDEAIKRAAIEHEMAEAKRVAAERGAKDAVAEFQRLDALRAEAGASRARAAASLEERPERTLLCDRILDIEDLLQKRVELKSRSLETQAINVRAGEDERRFAAHVAALKASSDQARTERDRLGAECEARRSAFAAIGEDALRRRDHALSELLAGLRDAANVLERHAQAQGEIEQNAAAAAQSARDIEQARAECAAAQISLATHKAARAEIIGLIDLADAALSPEAASLRTSLVAGSPCPVCGALDHPIEERSDIGAAFVARVQARRAELDQLIAGAASAIEAGERARAAAESRRDSALRLGKTALAAQESCASEYDAVLVQDLEPRRAALSISAALPASPEAALAPVLTLAAIVGAERATLAEAFGRAANLRADLDDLSEAQQKTAATLDQDLAALAAQTQALHAAQIERSGAARGLRELDDRLASIDRELAPYLGAGDISAADLDRDADADAARRQLRRLADERRTVKAAFAEAEAALQALEPKRAAAAEAHLGAIKTLESATSDASVRATDLDAARDARAALLNGEPTGAHRTRCNEIRLRARAALDSARAAESEAVKALAAAAQSESSLGAGMAEAELVLTQSEGAFAAAAAASGFTIERAWDLLDEAPAAREALREKIATIDEVLSRAATGLAERRRDLDDILAQGAEEEDAPALGAEILDLQEKAGAAQRRLGAIDSQVSRDDAARGDAEALNREIESARAGATVWRDVDEAIGSASGDKFRKFAQGVTLDHLVALANRHLAALAPRYRLTRATAGDLSLHVIDRDMGDEKRATRSLSGGERFLASLSLAIALSGLEGRSAFVDTLFIDEGFGSLDAETLDIAIDALESLHGQGRKVGVVTHVAAMIDRIAVQVRVEKRGNGRSTVKILPARAPA
ncbi:AAA family ATPase [Methylocapsa acidiphila]|uniref:AAA family ATPase n=1 Tax=Methylocapsa acidiphila TaxID=133552 RepID=UPI0003FE6149|nr:AAA family ATPase [Methylocapsa acidiphila]